ncbi:MAG: hypothetical protein Q7S11_05040 [bacterium]|nr:hypothetical protein [bacterium]
MREYFSLDSINNRSAMAMVALVVGNIIEVVPQQRLTKVLLQSDSGEKTEVVLHSKIFGDHNCMEMLGAKVICAVHNVVKFDPAPSHHDVYKDHQVLHILDGAKAGTVLEFKEERRP